jgi:hypothetical protein
VILWSARLQGRILLCNFAAKKNDNNDNDDNITEQKYGNGELYEFNELATQAGIASELLEWLPQDL